MMFRNYSYLFFYSLLLLLLEQIPAHSQFISLSPTHYNLKASTFLSSSNRLPFWFYSNQYGTVSPSSSLLISGGISSYSPDTSAISWSQIKLNYGLEALGRVGGTSKFHLVEGFGSLKYGIFELYAGRRRETVGLLGDTLLSSGSYVWSGNALPIPKLQLSTKLAVPFTKGFIKLSGFFAHGWLGSLALQDNPSAISSVKGYLHQKALYTEIGKPNGSLFIHAGFNHQVQWGGEKEIYPNLLFPSNKAWWWVTIGKSWRGSRVGNHLGTIDLGLHWKFKKGELFFYRQNIYEDGSLYHFLNIQDGLNGVAFTNKSKSLSNLKINKIVFEFLNTTSQGGDIFDLTTGVFGKDNYFNHFVYLEGWSYKRKMIGTPFITSKDDNNLWKTLKGDFTNNNRVKLLHLAASGKYAEWNWSIKTSLSFNYGVYDYSFEGTPKQFSALFQLQRNLKWLSGLEWTSSVGLDIGKLYNSSLGIQVGLRKQGYF